MTLTTSGFAPDTGTAMPDYETAMESETGTWTGRQNGERVMAVSVNISAMQPEYNAIRVVSSMSQIDATLRDYTTMITIVCIGGFAAADHYRFFFSCGRLSDPSTASMRLRRNLHRGISPSESRRFRKMKSGICARRSMIWHLHSPETEAMKNEFISSVSHELRTPLTASRRGGRPSVWRVGGEEAKGGGT